MRMIYLLSSVCIWYTVYTRRILSRFSLKSQFNFSRRKLVMINCYHIIHYIIILLSSVSFYITYTRLRKDNNLFNSLLTAKVDSNIILNNTFFPRRIIMLSSP